MRRTVLTAATAAALLVAGCSGDDASREPVETAAVEHSPSVASPTLPAPSPTTTTAPPPTADPRPGRPRQRDVLAISVDGLTSQVFDELGPGLIPAFSRLYEQGARTLNARTEVEQTVTLPNHAGMLTGRRIDADQGGHGVTWNDEIPGRTVPGPDGDGVESAFDVVHDAGGSTALFAGKDKFATFDRSWPDEIDRFEVDEDPDALVNDARADLASERRRFTFLHLTLPDVTGHASGWLSPAYLDAVVETDRLIGELLDAIDSSPRLQKRLVVVLTADHGGPEGEKDHDDARDIANFRIPFLVWGRGVRPADLYELNPDYADPGQNQPSYDGEQPVRNGDVANLVTDLLGLGPVPGSELDAGQDLDWR